MVDSRYEVNDAPSNGTQISFYLITNENVEGTFHESIFACFLDDSTLAE